MKTISAIILAIILLAASIGTGSVFAQGGGDDGYPVVTEPTPDPTNPPPDPPDPTPAPPQPTPEPPARTPNPTKPEPVVTAAPLVTTQAPDEPSPVCEGNRPHPVIAQIAERSHVAYDELISYYCQYDLDVGEIALLLNTFTRSQSGVSLKEIVAMRVENGLSWEKIWQALGIESPGEGEVENTNQPEAFNRNENRDKFNQQASNNTD